MPSDPSHAQVRLARADSFSRLPVPRDDDRLVLAITGASGGGLEAAHDGGERDRIGAGGESVRGIESRGYALVPLGELVTTPVLAGATAEAPPAAALEPTLLAPPSLAPPSLALPLGFGTSSGPVSGALEGGAAPSALAEPLLPPLSVSVPALAADDSPPSTAAVQTTGAQGVAASVSALEGAGDPALAMSIELPSYGHR